LPIYAKARLTDPVLRSDQHLSQPVDFVPILASQRLLARLYHGIQIIRRNHQESKLIIDVVEIDRRRRIVGRRDGREDYLGSAFEEI
jgi:hypothetical protein